MRLGLTDNPLVRCGVFFAGLLLTVAGCQPYRHQPATPTVRTAPPPVQPPRSQRGNPPFYEVLGQRYYVMASNNGYRERGVASWYGKKFHGNPTANGERYDMHGMTAAHKTLPLPTWVEVTNLRNGRAVIVKVNDRGPFVKNRLIDLSYAAASQLGMVTAGTTLVEVRALGAPAAAPAAVTAAVPVQVVQAAPAEPPPPLAVRNLYVQVGAFAERDNAERLMGRLLSHGLGDVFVLSDESQQPSIHRVRVGPVSEVADYDGIVARLASLGFTETHLVSED